MSFSDSPQIDKILQRFEAIEAELGSGVVGDDFVRLSKEYAELEATVSVIRSLRSTTEELAGVEEMMRSGDAEMEELARAEHDGLKQRLETLEHDLRLQLLPKDQFADVTERSRITFDAVTSWPHSPHPDGDRP